jgi:hypothetical protein
MERDQLKDQGVDGMMVSLGDWVGGVEWVQLAHEWGRWRTVVNAVMGLLAPRS